MRMCVWVCVCVQWNMEAQADAIDCTRIILKRVYCIWLWRFTFTQTSVLYMYIYTIWTLVLVYMLHVQQQINTIKNPFAHYSHPMFCRMQIDDILNVLHMCKWCAQMVVRVEREQIVISIQKRNLAHLERAKEFFLCAQQQQQQLQRQQQPQP